jgi:aminomethyltransferase
MPLQYEGTLAEHMAVRTTVGVFDVSHLGRFEVAGAEAAEVVGSILTNDLSKIAPGRCQYSLILNERGGIVDDIVIWWLEPERLLVLPNAANHDRVLARFTAAAGPKARVSDLRDSTALLAVQGPDAPRVLEEAFGAAPRRHRAVIAGDSTVAGTGYTGEAGGEVIVPLAQAEAAFRAILDGGATPCGLGARDTLRLELGLPLWGQDIDETTNPIEARLAWAVGWDTPFDGKAALEARRHEDPTRARVGFVLDDRRPPRHGYRIRSGSSKGEVTSGNFSPMLERGIGMGYLAPPPADDQTAMEIQVRDQWLAASLADMPFVRRP